jgi:hypothetical protein
MRYYDSTYSFFPPSVYRDNKLLGAILSDYYDRKKKVLYNLLTESKTSELFSCKLKCLPSVKKGI